MGLFSFLHKDKQDSDADDGGFYSRAEEESVSAARSRGKRKHGTAKESGAKPVDPVLPEKKRARRRLVGAVALVMALIIGLPMVLDSEPKPVADDIVIQIPSKDAPENRARIRRPAPPTSSMPGGLDPTEEVIEMPTTRRPSSLSASASDSTAPTVAASAEKPAPKVISRPSAIDRVSLAPPDRAEAPSGALRTEQKADRDRPSSAQPAGKEKEAARVASMPENKSAAKLDAERNLKEKKSGKVVLQVAALASQQKAGELQIRLASAGINSHAQKVATKSGERIRIRVGPYASDEEADKVRAKLSSLGLNGKVVSN